MKNAQLFLKTVTVSLINVIVAGFFGLGLCFINYFWLDFIQARYPRVSYDLEYQAKFGLACAAGFLVILTLRQFRTRFLDRIIHPGELIALVVLASLAMVWFTPTPGTYFVRHVMERMAQKASKSVYTADRDLYSKPYETNSSQRKKH